jgi:hypothetical protein
MPARSAYATEDDVKRFEDIKRLYIRARSHSRTKQKQEQETRYIEAFLLLTTVLEGTLVNLALKLLEKQSDLNALYGKRRKRYDYDNVINDLYLLREINTTEFKKLEKFRMKRNEYIHNLLSNDTKIVENKVIHIYKEYRGIAWTMIKKFRRRIGKIKKISI